MGITYLTVKLTNPQNSRKSLRHRFLVDSGAVYSVVPEEVLQKLKIKPIDTQEFILANGELVKKNLGQAQFEIMGKKRIVPVIFGEVGIYLLGATALENFGLMLDPLRRELKPLPMVI